MLHPSPLAIPNAQVRAAWQEQVARAIKTPGLLRALVQHRGELLPKFAQCYQHICALPRRARRVLSRKLHLSLAGAALLLALGQGQAIAATINVSGGCTLIDAITSANTDSGVGGCAMGSGVDTIELPASSTQTLTSVNNSTYENAGLPVVTTTITIEGHGSTITRDSSAPGFLFFVVGSSGNLTLNEATLSGGSGTITGGAISVQGGGVLMMTNSTITGNSAFEGGGIYNAGATTISDSTITGNTSFIGGGLRNGDDATLTVMNSTVSSNTAESSAGGIDNLRGTATISNSTITGNSTLFQGGGIENFDGTVTVTNSTISSNTTLFEGGGIYTYGLSSKLTLTGSTVSSNTAESDGGGVFHDSGVLTVTNSTISDNTASYDNFMRGGGIASFDGVFTLSNSTVSGNAADTGGGGVYTNSDLTLVRSLISGNTATTGPEITAFYLSADDHNLFGHSSNAGGYGFMPDASDLIPSQPLGAILGALANNGGPTQTHALVTIPSSPAIDASPDDADCQAADQRGVTRPQGLACDIGAFEVMVNVPEVCGNCLDDDGDGKIDLADSECSATELSTEKGSFSFKPALDEDQLSLTATFPLGPVINPPTEGVTVQFFDNTTGQLVCVQVPAGPVVTKPPGWKIKTGPTGTTWSFSDAKDGSLGDSTKDSLSVQCNTKKNVCTVKLNVKEANIAGDAAARNLTTGVVIGDDRLKKEQAWTPNKKGAKLSTK